MIGPGRAHDGPVIVTTHLKIPSTPLWFSLQGDGFWDIYRDNWIGNTRLAQIFLSDQLLGEWVLANPDFATGIGQSSGT